MSAGARADSPAVPRADILPPDPAQIHAEALHLAAVIERNRHALPSRTRVWSRFLSSLPGFDFAPAPVRGSWRQVYLSRYLVVKVVDFDSPDFSPEDPDFTFQPFWREAMLYYWALQKGSRVFPWTAFWLDGPYPIQIQERAVLTDDQGVAARLLAEAQRLPGGSGLSDIIKDRADGVNVGCSLWDGRPVIIDWDLICALSRDGSRRGIWFQRCPRRFAGAVAPQAMLRHLP